MPYGDWVFFLGVLNGDDLGMVYGIGFTTLNDLVDGFKHVLSPIHRHGMHCHEPNDTLKTQNQPCDICDQKPSMIIPVDFQYVYPRLDDIRLPFDPITRSIWDAPSLIKNHQNLGCVIFFFLHIFPTFANISNFRACPISKLIWRWTSRGNTCRDVSAEAAPSNAGIAEAARRLRARRSSPVNSWVPGQPYHSPAVRRLVSWPKVMGMIWGWWMVKKIDVEWFHLEHFMLNQFSFLGCGSEEEKWNRLRHEPSSAEPALFNPCYCIYIYRTSHLRSEYDSLR